jgi:hypothetical protein
MERIYHPYWLWEDYKAGFYENISGEEKKQMILKVVEMFNSKSLTKEFMNRVVTEWKYSCEHNLTNESLNKIIFFYNYFAFLFKISNYFLILLIYL